MGDMADMHLVNIEENAVHMGEDWYPLALPRGYRTRTKTCKYCGTENLHWGKKMNRWRLVSFEGKTHCCTNYKNRNGLKVNAK